MFSCFFSQLCYHFISNIWQHLTFGYGADRLHRQRAAASPPSFICTVCMRKVCGNTTFGQIHSPQECERAVHKTDQHWSGQLVLVWRIWYLQAEQRHSRRVYFAQFSSAANIKLSAQLSLCTKLLLDSVHSNSFFKTFCWRSSNQFM